MIDIAYTQILPYLPPRLREILAARPGEELAGLEEIRLRPAYPVLCRFHSEERLLAAGGGWCDQGDQGDLFLFTGEDMRRTLLLLADSSLYALEEELRRGYITLPGGHRAGLTGRAVLEQGRVKTIKEISGVNLRLARSLPGCAKDLLPRLLDEEGQLQPTLLISPPRAGKTTLLRDLARLVSDGCGVEPQRVGIVDERSELAAMRQGQPQLAVGLRTDVLDGCPKAEGMTLLLRSMSPQVLVTDEIGRPEDADAVLDAALAGVVVLASAHGGSEEEVRLRPALARLLDQGSFRRLVLLSRRQGPATVERVYQP